MAMSLSQPHPEQPYELTGVKLGDEQFAMAEEWEAAGRLALVGIGVEPGLSDVFARYAADHLFSEIDELGRARRREPRRSTATSSRRRSRIWTTIEECLNPPVIWEQDRGWFTTEPFSEPEVFDFPEGIGPVECVNVEHEEVLLIPRWVEAKRVTFKYGLGDEFIDVLQDAAQAGPGPDRAGARARASQVSPRDVVAACLPDPAGLGDRMHGKTCAGTWVTRHAARTASRAGLPLPRGRQRLVDGRVRRRRPSCGRPRSTRSSRWSCSRRAPGRGAGVLGPEAFDAVPFLDLLDEYGSPWGMREEAPAAV